MEIPEYLRAVVEATAKARGISEAEAFRFLTKKDTRDRTEYSKKYYRDHRDKNRDLGKKYYHANKDKRKAYRKEYIINNIDKIKAKEAEWRSKNSERISELARKSGYLNRHGITFEDAELMLKNQNNKCAICKKEVTLGLRKGHVDHDHTTDEIRGILCSPCNLMLGHAKDDITVLFNAINYLNKNKFSSICKAI